MMTDDEDDEDDRRGVPLGTQGSHVYLFDTETKTMSDDDD
jgi:hypothetical protein